MKLKKVLALGLATIMSASMLVGCGNSDSGAKEEAGSAEGNQIKVGMITDTGGVNDESFNQSAWSGFQQAQEKFGKDKLVIKYLESSQDADYAPNIDTFVEEEMDLIVGVGFKLEPAITEAAKAYPEQEFALIDAVNEGGQLDNVTSLLFEDNVSSYLTGLVAGRMTETNKVAYIGGMKSPVMDKFEYGFTAGVEAANPDAKVLSRIANSFSDSALGKDIANQMHSNGVDIIFSAAGGTGIGAIEAAKENNKKAIGVDQDQNKLAPENIITSAMKNIDVAVLEMITNLVEGNHKGGEIIVNSLEKGGVGIAPTSKDTLPPDVLEFVNAEAEKIKAGEIKVPSNEEEYKALKK